MRTLFSLLLILTFVSGQSQTRSDSIDVLNYKLAFDFSDFQSNTLFGQAELKVLVKAQSLDFLNLDLLKLGVNDVVANGNRPSFTHNDTLLRIDLSPDATFGDTLTVEVNYDGLPHAEAAAFGGFFFRGGLAYNIGVAFQEHPHNYGRVWFPCVDDFVDRATYQIDVKTTGGLNAACSGELLEVDSLGGDTLLHHWAIEQTLPTYLVSMAVGDLNQTSWPHVGRQDTFPVDIFSPPAKTPSVAGSFSTLDDAISIYETAYSHYAWPRVGYVVLPMNGGAMEHGMNIAYPNFVVNGNLQYETLMAHELSHSWWGNLVTCEKQEEMWLNEGWASFSEWLYLEKQYGWETAQHEVEEMLHDLLKNLHHDEGGYRDLVSIPGDLTYGSHVYDKGALTALALREYLGEVAFTDAVNRFLLFNRYRSINSEYLRDELEKYSLFDLHPFFEEWVFSPGWASVSLDTFLVTPTTGLTRIDFELSQQNKGRSFYSDRLPLEISIVDSFLQAYTLHVNLNELRDTLKLNSVINQPAAIFVNRRSRLPLAISSEEIRIGAPGVYNFDHADFNLNVSIILDSALVRVEEHWTDVPMTAQDMMRIGVRANPDRWWSMQGFNQGSFAATTSLVYNTIPSARLDLSLDSVLEDSLVLLHRPYGHKRWQIYSNYTLNAGNPSDGLGAFSLSEVHFGDYAFGVRDVTAGLLEKPAAVSSYAYPNPATDRAYIKDYEQFTSLEVLDINGRILSFPYEQGILRLDDVAAGTYSLRLRSEAGVLEEKLIVQ